MSRTLTILNTILLVLLVLAILGGLLWANTLYARDNPGGKDFLVPWLAVRTFFQYGDNPYGDPATQRAQVVYYGNLVGDNQDPLRLSLPFPVVLFYFPFALVTDFTLARGLWMTCLEIALAAMAFLSLRLTGWKLTRTLLPVLLIFSVLWVYGFLPLVGNRAVIFVALAIVGLLLALRDGRDELAGALLIVPFFKPDISGLLVLLIFWWAIYNRRGRILAGFLMTLVFLLAVSFFIISNWFMPFIGGLISNLSNRPSITPGGILASWWPAVGPRLAWALTGLLLVILFVEWRGVRHKDFRHFLWTASLTLAVTPLLGIPVIPQDFVLLFFPLVFFLSILAERWSSPGRWGVAGFGLLAIFFGFWSIAASLVLSGATTGLTGALALVFPVLLVLGLYWMRWWAVRPPRTWSDRLP